MLATAIVASLLPTASLLGVYEGKDVASDDERLAFQSAVVESVAVRLPRIMLPQQIASEVVLQVAPDSVDMVRAAL